MLALNFLQAMQITAGLSLRLRKTQRGRLRSGSVLLGHIHLTQLCVVNHSVETVPQLLSPPTCLPRCLQEALCTASTKAIFSYGLTKHQGAARSPEHQTLVGNDI